MCLPYSNSDDVVSLFCDLTWAFPAVRIGSGKFVGFPAYPRAAIMYAKYIAGIVFASGLVQSGWGFAADTTIAIEAAGEAFQGPPSLELRADGKVLGSATLSMSLDTASGASLRKISQANLQSHIETLSFTVPNLDGVKQLEIAFANDFGDGKAGDRNVYIRSVRVGDHVFGPWSMWLEAGQNATISDTEVALFTNGTAYIRRPLDGWVQANAVAAVAENVTENVVAGSCSPTAPLIVEGYAKNSSDPPQSAQTALAKLATALKESDCLIEITGFAGGGSSENYAKRLAEARAMSISTRLAELGIPGSSLSTKIEISQKRQVRIEVRPP